jgi:hypothetical protein
MMVFSLGTGPDGCIYGGSVSLLHLFKYDPGTDVLADLGFPYPGGGGEFYSLHTHGERLYMAAYSSAVLGTYQPSEPWDPGTDVESNPRRIGPTGGEQNRPHALTSAADGRVFIGSEPDYGEHGGALSIYDPVTDSFEVHRHIVPNQTVLSLTASRDGWTVYGGSSIRGGTGTEPLVRRAHFFAWDVRKGEKVVDIVPVVGADHITALATAPDGKIYGCAGSTLFVFDPETGEIIHKQSAQEGQIIGMVVGEDGLIYGRGRTAIFRMKPLPGPGEMVRFELLHTADDRGLGLALDAGKPVEDLVIYDDSLEPGWTISASGADVELASPEMVEQGACQKVETNRFCTLEYVPPDPWSIALSGYERLVLSFNPGSSAIDSILVTKTGPGSAESISLLVDYDLELVPGMWSEVSVPVRDLDWAFGSRLESLKLVVLGAGTFYLDSIRLEVPEASGILLILLLALCPISGRKRPNGRS